MTLLEHIFYGNTLLDWGIALGIALAAVLVLVFLKLMVVRKLSAYARRTSTVFDDIAAAVIARTNVLFLFVLSLYLGSLSLALSETAAGIVVKLLVVTLLLQASIWGTRFITLLIDHYRVVRKDVDGTGVTTASFLGFTGKLILWVVTLLLVLDNLGVDVTTLVASLGITGIAVALAVQNILGDLFASFSIAMDKPFVIGDFIIVGDARGTVEYIGLKTTRIRSLSGEQIVFSNAELLKSRIHNYQKMEERRVSFVFGVIYQTPSDKLKSIPKIVRELIESQPKTRFDRAHFKDYGDSSLNFEVVYYVLDADYNVYMDIQQSINLGLYARFEKEGIEFAYPTRTVYLSKDSAALLQPAKLAARA